MPAAHANARRPTIAVFCMPEVGHFQALRPVVTRLAARGSTWVFTHPSFQSEIERSGGRFVDLFTKYPIQEADDVSQPIPCRYVSFAGRYADQIIRDVAALRPSLIVADTFAVIGPVVATALDIPYVSLSSGHNVNPAVYFRKLQSDDRVAVSETCQHAVERLRVEFGLENASPFSYVTTLSPYLNILAEPPEFVDASDRVAFEPMAFFGCLPDPQPSGRARSRVWFENRASSDLRVYVSFGTVGWRYFARQAAASLASISRACTETEGCQAVISLAGAHLAPTFVSSLESGSVVVHDYVDQMEVLEQADVFVTHHGANSTHEAVFHRVPMISHPFFWDQPDLAKRCQQLGLAIPLADSRSDTISAEEVKSALGTYVRDRSRLAENLLEASAWERATLAGRDAIIDRVLQLSPKSPRPAARIS